MPVARAQYMFSLGPEQGDEQQHARKATDPPPDLERLKVGEHKERPEDPCKTNQDERLIQYVTCLGQGARVVLAVRA